jgi:DNA-binding transcriptional LysR family regulator
VDRYLHRAALTRSVSGAPAKCKLGRSLSKVIARFEEELGIHLVLRSTRAFHSATSAPGTCPLRPSAR